MNEHIKTSYRAKAEAAAKALQANQMDARVVENTEALLQAVSELIPEGTQVSSGGSQTLLQTGLDAYMREHYDFYFRGRKDDQGNPIDCERKAFTLDWYVSGTNAITLNGELFFVDGNGNRVAAVTFGPKNVLIVAGANKIVRDLKEAEERVKLTAAPPNCVRLNKNTGCRKTGYCVNCKSEDRICSLYLTCGFQQNKNRIKVLILPEDFGY